MSKLNEENALELEPDADGVEVLSAVRLSKVEAKDMNMGLLAIVVNGALEARPVLDPNPKSICMAPSVAVGWGIVSSSKLSMAGSKLVRELQSRGFVVFDDMDAAGDAADWAGDIAENID